MKRALLVALFGGALAWSACGHDWGPFEPSGSGSGGSAGGSTRSGGGGGAQANGGSSANGGSGGAGSGGAGANAACGNGMLNGNEECDDGNDVAGDGCTNCKVDCDEPGAFKDPSSHHCYWVVATPASWTTAQGLCNTPGRVDAAALSTQSELDLVKPHLAGESWLGGHYLGGGNWAWTNGEPWGYGDDQNSVSPPWVQAHFGGHGAIGCVAEETSGGIDAHDCSEEKPVVCERTPTVAKP
jgi:cysteine-rich repeat protein